MPKVLVQNEALEVELEDNENLRDGLARHKLSVYGNWFGKVVRNDKVLVIEGRDNLSVPSNKEVRKLGEEAIAVGYRLGSECQVTGDVQIHTQP
ncbi:MAG: hypothetical protein KDB07_06540 [Planctomycetes bacterium]|nr:hypothetical protein [Planctomycetota bacterium]